jgi:hypothetical protein
MNYAKLCHRKYLTLLISSLLLLSLMLYRCRPKEEIFTDSPIELRFSDDTVLFDTVFSGSPTVVRNVTKRLYIYNTSVNALRLAMVRLGGGTGSAYKITVDGIDGAAVSDLEILGKDSLLVLITVSILPANQNLPFIVTDSLIVEHLGRSQQVQLVSWGQDALFLNGEVIGCDTTWAPNRPVVIYNSALVDSACSLTILPGTQVYMHNGSNLFVAGTLLVQGEAENKVHFRGTRLEQRFINVPGQWGGIIFLETATSNSVVDHAIIRNATNGIRFGKPDDGNDNPDLIISNSLIRNCTGSGLLFISTDVDLINTVVGNCQISTISVLAGGAVRLFHCSLADFASLFQREDPSLVFSNNLVLADNSVLRAGLNLTAINSILYGSEDEELLLSNDPGAAFVLDIRASILRTQLNNLNVNGNKINQNPKFKNQAEVDYQLDTLSPARNAGIPIQGLPAALTDFKGISRPQADTVDIGAFERVE